MKINLTQEEFQCLWDNLPSFKKRVFDALEDKDVSAPTSDSIADAVFAQFGNVHKGQGGNFISAIKFVRGFVRDNNIKADIKLSDGRTVDVTSLTGAKTFVENHCMNKGYFD